MFYPRFFEWMDQAAHTLRRAIGITAAQLLPPDSTGLPLVRASAEFLAPVRTDDELEVRTRVVHLGRSSLGLGHEIWSLTSNRLAARGEERRVFARQEHAGSLSSSPFPEPLREALQRYQDPGTSVTRR